MNMSHRAINTLVLVAAFVLSAVPVAAGTIFTTDFDSYSAPASLAGQDGWQWVPGYQGDGWRVRTLQEDNNIVRTHSGQQSVVTGPKKNEWVGQTFQSLTSGVVDISFYINNYQTGDTDMSCQFFLSDGLSDSANRAAGVIISGTDIKYYKGSGGSTDSGYDLPADDTWTKLRLSCDLDNRSYQVFMTLDGGSEVAVATDGGFKDPAATGISAFYLRNNWFEAVDGPQIWIDDVTVSHIPEPATLAMLAAGAGVAAIRRRRS